MSTFSGISTALSALNAHRLALDVTGNNVANANTDGYSRQRVSLSPLVPASVPSKHAARLMTGSGVSVDGIHRITDEFLNARLRCELGTAGYLTARKDVLAAIEQVLREPSDTGLSAQLDQFWAAWQDVANEPGQLAARSALLQQGEVVAGTLNQAARALDAQWNNTLQRVEALTNEVNATAASVADLNKVIRAAAASGQQANELMDQRDLLVQRLTELTGAEAQMRDDDTVEVQLGGSPLISGMTAFPVTIGGGNRLQVPPVPVSVAGAESLGGVIGGLLDGLNTELPTALQGFDTVATQLRDAVNTAHAAGFDLAGNQGGAFFTGSDALTLAAALPGPDSVAARAAGEGPLGGGNALTLVDTAGGAVETAWRSLVVETGVKVQSATRRADAQNDVVRFTQTAQQGVAGVDLDEEMTNMVMFQRAYEGAARVLTAVDEMLDVLINRTGIVGR
jgi:flagellar hook-associated protein 1 FlgK